jgi:hypothetical protein
MKVWNNIALPDVPMPLTTPAATQPTPLLISALVNNNNPTDFDHTVDEAGMCADGFTQNVARGCGPAGTCGVTGMVDVMTLRHDIANYPTSSVFEVICC